MTPYKILDDPTLGEVPSKNADADADDGSVEYADFLRLVLFGPAAPEPSADPPAVASDEELWSEIIGGGGTTTGDDAAPHNRTEALLDMSDLIDGIANGEEEEDKKGGRGGDDELAALSDLIDGTANGEEENKGRGGDGDDELAALLDCLNGEGGGGGCSGTAVDDDGGARDADFDAFVSYFNSRQRHVDNFGFLPAQRADEALWSKIVSGMSSEQKMELTTNGADPAGGMEPPPSWWNIGSWFGPSARVQPELQPGEDAIEQEDSFV
ncbi:hypothetical protein ACHAW5_008791 [Stephanodiscus triporus]|uniref:Uncharacterized protein n=1 Tax=Stephanodiscus triporus TaxID=2934178 RepID=A0ABD3MSS6_9STRA